MGRKNEEEDEEGPRKEIVIDWGDEEEDEEESRKDRIADE